MMKPSSRRRLRVLLLIGALPGQYLYAAPDPVPTVVSAPVAVFPLRNATGDAGLNWVSIGLQDSLTVDLWYVSALHTQALPQFTEAVGKVCPDQTLACVAGQDLTTWRKQAQTLGYGGFIWGEYRRDGGDITLRLAWYGPEGDTPLAEWTQRGQTTLEWLAASTEGLRALLATRAIPVTEAEQARMRTSKTTVQAAWKQNALGYWEQIRYGLADDDAQRTARASVWERYLQVAVTADPNYAEAWNNLGYHDDAVEETTASAVAFDRALKLKPDLIDALIGRGSRWKAEEKLAEALPWYERAVALNPSLALHRRMLLEAYLEAKQPEAGLAQLTVMDEFLKRHRRETERQELNPWRGRYHEALQQWPQALAAYEAWETELAWQVENAYEQRLELANQLAAIGETLADQEPFKDAEAYQRRVLAIREAVQGPEHLDVAISLDALAQTLRKQQRDDEAEALRSRAKAIGEIKANALDTKLQRMGWKQLSDPAREWWKELITLNVAKIDTVLTLLDALSQRQATLEEFFLVYMTTDAKSVAEMLEVLGEDNIAIWRQQMKERCNSRLHQAGNRLREQRGSRGEEKLDHPASAI